MKKNHSFFIYLVTIFFLLSSKLAFTQWLPELRLTNDPFSSRTFGNSIAANGNIVHVVWYDNRNGAPIGNFEIYYKRSTDGGLNWGTDMRLTNNSAPSYSPSIAISGSIIHVVWEDFRFNSEIYYKKSTDAGLSWGNDIRLTNSIETSNNPSISVSGSFVHVVWYDYRDGNSEIYYKRSTNDGISWGSDIRLTSNSLSSDYPSITSIGSKLHVVWIDNRDGNKEIYNKRSPNNGTTWNDDVRLTNDSIDSHNPTISSSNSTLHLVWYKRGGSDVVYYKRSSDEGESWSEDVRITNHSGHSFGPSVVSSGSIAHILWSDSRDGNYEIYYKRSTNGGINWESDERLTNSISSSGSVSAAISGSAIQIVWEDTRDGYEIYFKKNPSGNTIGINQLNYLIPETFTLCQNYPNPFNPTTNIEFSIPEKSFVNMKIFDITGKEVAELVNENLSAGTFRYEFNAENLPSGLYFYKLESSKFSETKKMIILK